MSDHRRLAEVQRILADPDATGADLAPFVEIDETRSLAFAPAVRLRDDVLESTALEGDVLVGALNGFSRRRRARAYRRRIDSGWDGLRLVSEGDSWFQYPLLLDDVIDHLSEHYAIHSLGAAGDLLEVMLREDEISAAIERERPHGLLLSGGGNDMVGGGRLASMVRRYDPDLSAEDYPKAGFDRLLAELESHLAEFFERLRRTHPDLKVFVHGYDHAIPDRGRWLGEPLEDRGIRNRRLQRAIVRELIDRYNERLAALAERFAGQVVHVDCRGTVAGSEWHDELHPTSRGFGVAADRFRECIERELGTRPETTRRTRRAGIVGGSGLELGTGNPPGFAARCAEAARRFEHVRPDRRGLERDAPEHDRPDRVRVRRDLIPEQDRLAYERILGANNLFHVNYFAQSARAARAVCKIQVCDPRGVPLWNGTGFLVAPGLLLTNNHVLPDRDLRGTAIFDHEYDIDYREKPTVRFALEPDALFVTHRDLDYTFVAVHATAEDGTDLREFGWLRLLPRSGKALIGEPVSIVQHPNGQLKRVALRDSRILGIPDAPGDDFIHYSTDTEPGSSGSAVLNDQLYVVALHHAGVPDGQGGWRANEGVRISRIFDSLEEDREHAASDAEQVLRRLGAALQIQPATTVETPPAAPANADEDSFERSRWSEDDGYREDFLDVTVPLPTIDRRDPCRRETHPEPIVLPYTHFSVSMNPARRLAYVAAVNVDGSRARSIARTNTRWRTDRRLDRDQQMDNAAYRNNDLDRGHLVRRTAPNWGTLREAEKANEDTYHYTNAAPQHEDLNQGNWLDLEDYLLDRARQLRMRVSIFTGPVFGSRDRVYRGRFQLPEEFWKVVAWVDPRGRLQSAGYMLTQSELIEDVRERAYGDYRTYRVPVSEIASATGLDFGGLVDGDERERTESARVISEVSDVPRDAGLF